MLRILAIDFGERRIGLAISDPLGITAQGLPTIDTRKTKDFLSFIQNVIQEKSVKGGGGNAQEYGRQHRLQR